MLEAHDVEGAEGAVDRGHALGGADAVAAGDEAKALAASPADLGALERATEAATTTTIVDGDIGGEEGVAEAKTIVLLGPRDARVALKRGAEGEAEDLAAGALDRDEAEACFGAAAQVLERVATRGLVGGVLDRHDRGPVAVLDAADQEVIDVADEAFGAPFGGGGVVQAPQRGGDPLEEIVEVAA